MCVALLQYLLYFASCDMSIKQFTKVLSRKAREMYETLNNEATESSSDESDGTNLETQSEPCNTKQTLRWLTPEKIAIKRQLADYLIKLRAPGKEACECAIKKEPALQNRRWNQIKTWVHNANKTTKARNLHKLNI